MPIYAFRCTACGHDFDRLQKMSDPDPAACPACAEACVQRQLTAPSFRLSGSGWYETDFKKDGDRKRNLAGDGSDGAAAKPDAATAQSAAKAADAGNSKAKSEGGDSTPASKPATSDGKPAAKAPVPAATSPAPKAATTGPGKTTDR